MWLFDFVELAKNLNINLVNTYMHNNINNFKINTIIHFENRNVPNNSIKMESEMVVK